jgi:hypothetical protein
MITLRKLMLGGALFTLAGAFANAGTMQAIAYCGTNVTPGAVSTFNCGTVSSIIGGNQFISGFIVYDSTYQNVNTGNPTLVTNFSFSGATFVPTSDTLTTTDNGGTGATPASSSALNTYFTAGGGIAAGFDSSFTAPTGSLVVSYTDTLSGGTVLNNQVLDYAEYVITYSQLAPVTTALYVWPTWLASATAAAIFSVVRSTLRALSSIWVQCSASAVNSSSEYGAGSFVYMAWTTRWAITSAKRRFGAVECV